MNISTQVIRDGVQKITQGRGKKPQKLLLTVKGLVEQNGELMNNGQRSSIEYTEMNKLARILVKFDIIEHQPKQVEGFIESKRRMRVLKSSTIPNI